MLVVAGEATSSRVPMVLEGLEAGARENKTEPMVSVAAVVVNPVPRPAAREVKAS